MDLSRYKELKNKGLVTLSKDSNGFSMVRKHFCPDTGEELGHQQTFLDLRGLRNERLRLLKRIAEEQQELSNLQALIKDLELMEDQS